MESRCYCGARFNENIMAVTKRDVSGAFDAELRGKLQSRSAALDSSFYLNHKGITFISDHAISEWTEVGVELRVPKKITCRAVVVECTRCLVAQGYKITLLFLDLPKRARSHLDLPLAGANAASISIFS
jgi:hypothetical protein